MNEDVIGSDVIPVGVLMMATSGKDYVSIRPRQRTTSGTKNDEAKDGKKPARLGQKPPLPGNGVGPGLPVHTNPPNKSNSGKLRRKMVVVDTEENAAEEGKRLQERLAQAPPVISEVSEDDPVQQSSISEKSSLLGNLEKRRRSSIKGYMLKDGHTVSSKENRLRKPISPKKEPVDEDMEVLVLDTKETISNTQPDTEMIEGRDADNSFSDYKTPNTTPAPEKEGTALTEDNKEKSDGIGMEQDDSLPVPAIGPDQADLQPTPMETDQDVKPEIKQEVEEAICPQTEDFTSTAAGDRSRFSDGSSEQDVNPFLDDYPHGCGRTFVVHEPLLEDTMMPEEKPHPFEVPPPVVVPDEVPPPYQNGSDGKLEPKEEVAETVQAAPSSSLDVLLSVTKEDTQPNEVAPGIIAGESDSATSSPSKSQVAEAQWIGPNDDRLQNMFSSVYEKQYEIVPDLHRVEEKDRVYVNVGSTGKGSVPTPMPPVPLDNRLGFGDFSHVRLPWSYGNQTASGYRKFLLVEEALEFLASGIEGIRGLFVILEDYLWVEDYSAIAAYYEQLPSREEKMKLLRTIEGIARLALRAKQLINKPLRYLVKNVSGSVTLSQEQCACLLANAFLCTMPAQRAQFNHFNMERIFSLKNTQSVCKLKFLFHYFEKVLESMPTGCVTFRREVVAYDNMPDWGSLNEHMMPSLATGHQPIEDCHKFLQMDFANKFIGGGVLGHGAVQEEIRFLICPEMIVSLVLAERLEDNEALFISGAQKFSNYSGYGSSLAWEPFPDFGMDNGTRDKFGRLETELVAIDAVNFYASRGQQQYSKWAIDRELNKAYVGFRTAQHPKRPIATGNWGCGAFAGDKELKSLIQLMAASVCGRDVYYAPYEAKKFGDRLTTIYGLLVQRQVSVGQLYRVLCSYKPVVGSRLHLFDYVANRTHPDRKVTRSA